MADDADKIKKQKKALLSELESIKGLLNDDAADAIPVLRDAIIEDTVDPDAEHASYVTIDMGEDSQEEAEEPTPPTQPGVLPGQQSLFEEKKSTKAAPPKQASEKTSLATNPFLPPHVRHRLDKEAKEAANKELDESSISQSYTERLVDQLIAHHIPKIEAELRRQLETVVKEHNERMKK